MLNRYEGCFLIELRFEQNNRFCCNWSLPYQRMLAQCAWSTYAASLNIISSLYDIDSKTTGLKRVWIRWPLFITRVSEVIIFSPCVFVCLSRCLSGRFNYEGLVPHKQYFTGTLLGMSSCASYVSRTHDVIDDVTRSQSRSNFESDISPSIFELERWSKAQNVGNAHGYLSGLFNFRYNFW